MKSALILVLSPLFLIGVFGDEVSVMEGDSVTLHTGVTEIQKDDGIQWRLNGTRIAKLSSDSEGILEQNIPDGAFGDRLKLDNKTGDLKITDIKTTDAGEYKLEITSTRGSSEKTFRVTVSADEVKSVSVLVGDKVTLHTDLTKIQRYDEMQWRFERQNSPIAEISRAAGILSTHDGPDGRFRDRLKLDCLTGSLIIKNIGMNHAGVYEVTISISSSRSTYTIHKSFSVTVSDGVKSVSVTEGHSVTLQTGVTEIQTDDFILWMFGDTRITVYDDVPDGRFRDRLKLDHQTGSLTITNTRTTDSGLYELQINSSRRTIHRRFTVTVSGSGAVAGIVVGVILLAVAGVGAVGVIYYRRRISELERQKQGAVGVTEGGSVALQPYDTEILKDDNIQLKFKGSLIAERKGENGDFTVHDDVHDGIFKNRLYLDKGSGSLIIKDIRSDMSGRYELRIIRRGRESLTTFRVSVFAKTDVIEIESVKAGDPVTLESGVTEIQRDETEPVSVKAGDPVTLETGVTGIQRDDQIQCKFEREDSPIAQIKGRTTEPFPSAADGTGSLTTKDSGFYDQHNNTTGESIKSFRLDFRSPFDVRRNPEVVPLMHVNVSDS